MKRVRLAESRRPRPLRPSLLNWPNGGQRRGRIVTPATFKTAYFFGVAPGAAAGGCVACGCGVAAAAGLAAGVGFGAAGEAVVAGAELLAAGVVAAVGDADGAFAFAPGPPGVIGWLPRLFGSLSILSASLLTTVTSLMALLMSAALRIVCRWLMSACLIWSRTPGSSRLSGFVSSWRFVSLKMIQRPSGK